MDEFSRCLTCNTPVGISGICSGCRPPYARSWCVGLREAELEQLIDAFKFDRLLAAADILTDLLDMKLPELPADVVIVPVPTIAPHIRVRGYDHSLLLAKKLAKKRGLVCSPLLGRATNTRQQGANRATRLKQAKQAFRAVKPIPARTYLLIDDIVTTGATLKYATKTLLEAGVSEVWVAAVAHQPSTK